MAVPCCAASWTLGLPVRADALGKRLAIDQLRVVLSRPTERLLWVDTRPTPGPSMKSAGCFAPRSSSLFLPITAEALRTCLDEEELEIEERLQRCQQDARSCFGEARSGLVERASGHCAAWGCPAI